MMRLLSGLAPAIDALAAAFEGRATVAKVNVAVDRLAGVQPKSLLAERLEAASRATGSEV